jgi:hypothetical protein
LADIRDSREVLVKKTVNGYHSAGVQVNEVPLAVPRFASKHSTGSA